MRAIKVDSFRTLMNEQTEATIACLYTGKLVRHLTVDGEQVIIDPNIGDDDEQHPIITVDLDTPIGYTPWVFDRGNMTFEHESIPQGAKICGEGDVITYGDGEKRSIMPTDELQAKGKHEPVSFF
jgi:hypothetical protein